jgi:hypothetical protein
MVTKVGKKKPGTKMDAVAASVHVTRSFSKVAAIATAPAIAPDVALAIAPDKHTAPANHMGDSAEDSSSKSSKRGQPSASLKAIHSKKKYDHLFADSDDDDCSGELVPLTTSSTLCIPKETSIDTIYTSKNVNVPTMATAYSKKAGTASKKVVGSPMKNKVS